MSRLCYLVEQGERVVQGRLEVGLPGHLDIFNTPEQDRAEAQKSGLLNWSS